MSLTAKFLKTASKLTRNRKADSAKCDEDCLSQDDEGFSSTDAGDDVEPIFVDLDDFASTSSDGEVSNDEAMPLDTVNAKASVGSCVYSITMLLRFGAAVRGEADASPAPVRYSARCKSELPAVITSKPKSPTKACANPSSTEESWWRASPAATADSWRA